MTGTEYLRAAIPGGEELTAQLYAKGTQPVELDSSLVQQLRKSLYPAFLLWLARRRRTKADSAIEKWRKKVLKWFPVGEVSGYEGAIRGYKLSILVHPGTVLTEATDVNALVEYAGSELPTIARRVQLRMNVEGPAVSKLLRFLSTHADVRASCTSVSVEIDDTRIAALYEGGLFPTIPANLFKEKESPTRVDVKPVPRTK